MFIALALANNYICFGFRGTGPNNELLIDVALAHGLFTYVARAQTMFCRFMLHWPLHRSIYVELYRAGVRFVLLACMLYPCFPGNFVK